MHILSHRGYWKTPDEKNTELAFRRSFQLGYGTETDIRDRDGGLVIAHDPATRTDMPLAQFLAAYTEDGAGDSAGRLPLALNIKADGLCNLLQEALTTAGVAHYFVFDMSIPDMLSYQRAGLRFFTRHSDLETTPALYAEAAGVWLDSFGPEDWITAATLAPHLAAGKQICIVSPELHKRPHLPFWERLRSFADAEQAQILLCTDFPEEATTFFGPLAQHHEEGNHAAAA
jgi:glycerophosphoryl diester phosphodiesterase